MWLIKTRITRVFQIFPSYARINDRKFATVWRMNEVEAGGLLERVLAIDRVLYEQQLGLRWPEPRVRLLQQHELPSYGEAMRQLYGETGRPQTPPDHAALAERSVPPEKRDYADQMLADTRVLRVLLRQIAGETEFVVETRLMALLRPYVRPEQYGIVQLDHVFQALGIASWRDVSTLVRHFVPYTWCAVCSECLATAR